MDPLTLLAYFLLCLIVLGIAWYAMQWMEVSAVPARVVILVLALFMLLWILEGGRLPHLGMTDLSPSAMGPLLWIG
jgi:hypothetical protein